MTRHTLAVDYSALGGRWTGRPTTVALGGWNLAQVYPHEDPSGTSLIDLSARPKALVVGPAAEALAPLDPGRAAWDGQWIVCCRKPGERIVFDLAGPLEPSWPDKHYTDLTDGWVLLALVGPEARSIMQRMIPVDFEKPEINGPVFGVTRSHGLWVQYVNLKAALAGYLIATDRSQGQHLAAALAHAGESFGLRPAGLAGLGRLVESLGVRGN